ncbi:Crp/Fnr family transcriptional regulator [Bacillaceae bacterium S4-13-56]
MEIPIQSHLLCVSKVPIFNHLTNEELQEISSVIHHVHFKKGEVIYLSEDVPEQLFVVHKGKVKLYRMSESGREQLLHVLESGEFMGETSLFSKKPLTHNAEALEATDMCLIHRKELETFLVKYPSIAMKIIEAYSQRIEQLEELIEQMGLQDSEQRVASILLHLKPTHSSTIHLSFSKRDLASLIGTTQETLSRKLASFQQNGWIELKGQREIRILSEEHLHDIVSKK